MRSTMADIARESGVSTMTVSRVLSGQACVSPATRAKVLDAARQHRYEVNAQARNFVQKRSGFVGIATAMHLVGTEYFGTIMQGVESVFAGTPWDYALFNIQSSSFDNGNRLLKLYRANRVDGLLVIAPTVEDEFLDTFADNHFPLVVLGKPVQSSRVCWVGCDDYGGIQSLCAHLHAEGHRRIAFVGGPLRFSVAQQRERAYTDFCRQHRLALPGWFVQRGNYSVHSGREAGMALLGSPEGPTAIVAANDSMAIGVMEAARALHFDIPSGVSVVGFDDISLATDCFPALTTVRQPVLEMAVWGARLLHTALSKNQPLQGNVVLPTQLVQRASTTPPA